MHRVFLSQHFNVKIAGSSFLKGADRLSRVGTGVAGGSLTASVPLTPYAIEGCVGKDWD